MRPCAEGEGRLHVGGRNECLTPSRGSRQWLAKMQKFLTELGGPQRARRRCEVTEVLGNGGGLKDTVELHE